MKLSSTYYKMGCILLTIFLTSTFAYSQKYLVNSEWNLSFLTNDTSQYFYKKAKVHVDGSGDIYTLGSAITMTGHDFLLMKTNGINGDTIFAAQWGGVGNGEDVAMDMVVDPLSGYTYVVGASYQGSMGTDSLDAVIVAFDDMGAEIWHTYASDNSSYNDVFTALAFDGTALYACGTAGTSSDKQDFLLAKFDLAGGEAYSETYDYAGYNDVALQIVCVPGTNLTVAGLSQPTDSTWDYYIRTYKIPPMTFANDYRNYAGTGQLHRPMDVVYTNDHYYITGAVSTVMNGYDIQTAVLDTSLNLIWEHSWDGDGQMDMAHSIKVDNDGNVYITGRTSANSAFNIVTIKYDANGNEQFAKIYGDYNATSEVGNDLELYGDNVLVSGYANNGSQFVTLCYDTAGATRWIHFSEYGSLYPTDMATDGNGNIFIACPMTYMFYAEKMSSYYLTEEAAYDTAGVSQMLQNEILVKFNPAVVKTSTIDRKGKVFGYIREFIQDSTIAKMSAAMGIDLLSDDNVKVIKVYKKMTTADSISYGRSGNVVNVPQFWSMLRIKLPSTVTIDSALLDTLGTIMPDIYYATFNNVYTLFSTPNDVEYNQQECFHPTVTYPDGHINIEPAWDYEVGSTQVRIGVYDSGIYFPHPDFGGTLGVGAVGGGYDFIEDAPLGYGTTSPDDQGHGTACGGLIGAVRNNNLGIAGAAGGNDSAGIDGVKVYGMKIYNADNDWLSAADQYDAWFMGASSFGYGLHGMSLSYGQVGSTNYGLHEAMRYVYDNDAFFAAARGNALTNSTQLVMPSCEKDAFVLNIGGSGTDGNLKIPTNCDSIILQDNNNLSLFGNGVDVIAPATTALVKSLSNTSSNSYVYFNGTSASTPIVAGVAGLMLSNYDGQLFPEDVEYFLERFAKDKGAPGYQDSTGWGLVDAGAIMDSIHRPQFDVMHFNYSTQPLTSIVGTAGGGYEWFYFHDQFLGIEDDAEHWGYWYRVDVTINHTLPAGATIIDAWERNSDSKGWIGGTHFGMNINGYDNSVYLDTITSTYAKMHTYFYYLQSMYVAGIWYPEDIWLPANPFYLPNRQFGYSVYVANPTVSIQEQETNWSMNVYPNPSDEYVNILFKFEKDREVGFKLYDMAGRVLVSTNELPYSAGENSYRIDVSNLSAGIYILQMNSGNDHIQKKIIVH